MPAVIVLPTYNERDNIEAFLRAVRAVSKDLAVLVVDDDSPDGTAEVANGLVGELGGIEVLSRPEKDGLGSAYRAGFARVLGDHSTYDIIISMDADLSHDPAVIPQMLALIDAGADAVIGSRYVPGGGTPNWPLHRRLLSRWGNAYTRTVVGLDVNDCTSGFRAYRSDVLAEIDPGSTQAEGYAFLTELVRRLTLSGARIEETPIVFVNRTHGESKMSGRIIIESMVRVTLWGARDAFARLRGGRPPDR